MAEYQINEELISELIIEDLDETISISDKLIFAKVESSKCSQRADILGVVKCSKKYQ